MPMNFVGLESDLSDKVHLPRVASLEGDKTERCRIKIDRVRRTTCGRSRENEVRMVQNIDRRYL